MINYLKKGLILFLVAILLARGIIPSVVLGDDTDLSNQSTDTTVSASPDPSPTTDSNQDANPSPTPDTNPTTDTPSPTPTPTPDTLTNPNNNPTSPNATVDSPTLDSTNSGTTTLDANNNADTNNNINSTSNSGDNDSSSSPSTNDSTLKTGDSVSNTSAENDVNTTSVNSSVIFQTFNIFTTEDSDLDLSGVGSNVSNLIANNNLSAGIVNVSVINNAYVINSVSSSADSGSNNGGDITTGNAYSIVSLLNKINLTVINSQVHVITINIFGTLNGDILLPNINNQDCTNCSSVNATVDNNALVNNNLNSSAISGQNSSSATIDTGVSASYVDLLNIINTSIINTDVIHLDINNFGEWTGNLLTANSIGLDEGSTSLICVTCAATADLTVSNNALLVNNINSSANTGKNKGVQIKTGNAFSIISLFNLINTTLVNSHSIFGFINIFGKFNGDIKPKTQSVKADNPPTQETENQNQSEVRQTGGAIDVSSSNNVNDYVLPGDTVTTYVKVKNIGSGKIYNTKVNLDLFGDNGDDWGGASFNIGDIEEGKSTKLSTGLVLGKKTPKGHYIIRAYVTAETGDQNLAGQAESGFNLHDLSNFVENVNQNITPVVLASNHNPHSDTKSAVAQNTSDRNLILAIFVAIFGYIYLTLYKNRKLVNEKYLIAMSNKRLKKLKKLALDIRTFLY